MKTVGKVISNVSVNGEHILQIVVKDVEEFGDELLDISISKHRGKRSLDANGYYHALLHKYAEYEGVSDDYIHNDILGRYGQPMLEDGKMVYLVMADNDRYKELSYIHLKATDEVNEGRDGTVYRTFLVMKNSREYNTFEFSRIIDGLIQDIKSSGAMIETMTPAQLRELDGYKSKWYG